MHSSFGGQAQTRDKVERRRTLSRESLIPALVVARQHWPDHGQHDTCKAETLSYNVTKIYVAVLQFDYALHNAQSQMFCFNLGYSRNSLKSQHF